MDKGKLLTWTGTAVLVISTVIAEPVRMRASDVPDSEQVNKLLSEAKTMAFQLREDAVDMERFTRLDVSWEAHLLAIDKIKEHVNALAKQEGKLQTARTSASPWQKTAIDRIAPFIDELGGYTNAAIEHIKGDHSKHSLLEYKDYLEANADYASDLATMIGDFVNYGRSKQRIERLGAKVEVPAER